MSYNAIVLADSISEAGHRVTTLEVTFPRFILAEFNTHRVLSRNSASSRAIPVETRIAQIKADPFVPEAFGRNQRGMQAENTLEAEDAAAARSAWLCAADQAAFYAEWLVRLGTHKQHANRLLEPFAWHTAVVTSTEWGNWDALRVSKMAQPEMYKIAGMMLDVRCVSKPTTICDGEWHLPYVVEKSEYGFDLIDETLMSGLDLVKVCVGRCAAVSYERQSSLTDMIKDRERCDMLVKNGHMSPLEHALRPMTKRELVQFERDELEWRTPKNHVHGEPERKEFIATGRKTYFLGNVQGWVQYRKMIPGEDVYRGE